jgi:NAD(P) transhydrogenase subunit alpha
MSLTSSLGYGSLFSETGVQSFFIMILCTFIGFWSACRVNGAFHAPLMGLTNAMSSMVIFLAISFYRALPLSGSGLMRGLTTLTIFFLAMNLVGGLLITHRMLSLFTKKPQNG